MTSIDSFLNYFSKAFSLIKVIISFSISALGYILFPEHIYKVAVLAVIGAAICDIITKWWSICRLNGGYLNAVRTGKLQSKAMWDGTRVKIFSYLMVMILTGLSYRVIFIEQAGIFLASFVYIVLFLREAQSSIENLIDGGAKLQWLLLYVRSKEKEVIRQHQSEEESRDGL